MKSTEIRPGMAIEMDNQVWLVINTEHVKPGKGPAYTQLKLKNIKTGSNIEKRARSSEELTQAVLDRREMEYLYTDASGVIFMDSQSYDQLTIPKEILGKSMGFVKPNTVIKALVYDGSVVSIDLPAAVELEITDTPPGIKDATKTNQLKEATCETGLKTRVPAFINIGETIKISTETGEYLSRA